MILFLLLTFGLRKLFYENEYYSKVKWLKLVITLFVDFKKRKADAQTRYFNNTFN